MTTKLFLPTFRAIAQLIGGLIVSLIITACGQQINLTGQIVITVSPVPLKSSVTATVTIQPSPSSTALSTPTPTQTDTPTVIPVLEPTQIRTGCLSEFIIEPAQLVGLWQAIAYNPYTIERFYFKSDGAVEYSLEGVTQDYKNIEPYFRSGTYQREADHVVKIHYSDDGSASFHVYLCNDDLVLQDLDHFSVGLYAPIPEFCWLGTQSIDVCYRYPQP